MAQPHRASARARSGRPQQEPPDLRGTLGQEQPQTAGRIDAIAGQLLPIVDGHDHQLYDYTTVSNDSGTLRIDLPSAWADIEADRVRIAGGQREPSLSASFDLAQYLNTWGTPGVTVLGSGDADAFSLDALLDDLGLASVRSSCHREGRYPVRTDRHQGRLDLYTGCSDAGVTLVVARLRPREQRGTAAMVMLLRTPRDLEALDRALDSLVFTL